MWPPVEVMAPRAAWEVVSRLAGGVRVPEALRVIGGHAPARQVEEDGLAGGAHAPELQGLMGMRT